MKLSLPHIALIPGSHGYSWGIYTDRSMRTLMSLSSKFSQLKNKGKWRKTCDVYYGDAKNPV